MLNQHTNSEIKYRSDIDGLRAIAVLSVVGFHAFGVMGGFVGVDIFFVISGFLISTIIFENLEKKSFSFINFYQRRIRRIFPSLIFVLTCCLVFGWFVLYSDEYEQLGKHIAAGAAFFSNIVLWQESGYFDVIAEKKLLLHLWSLAIEEQFYFVWPIFVCILWKFRTNFLWGVLVVLGLSFGLNIWLIGIDSIATFYSPLTRFWELIAGGCLAYIALYRSSLLTKLKSHSNLFSNIGFLLIITCIAFFNKEISFPGWWALLPVFGTALLITTGMKSWIGQKILSSQILVWFGLISYPLYLWHWPLLTFVRLLNDDVKYLKIVAVAVSILLAWVSFKYIERPMRYGNYIVSKTIFLLAAMCGLAIAGLAVYHAAGFESRINDGHHGQLAKKYREQLEWPESYNNSKSCNEIYKEAHYCLIGDPEKPISAAILGDSHANHFYPGLDSYYKKQGGNLLLLGSPGCPPFIGVDWIPKSSFSNPKCFERNNNLYQKVLDDKNIKTIFIAFHHNTPFDTKYALEDRISGKKYDNNLKSAVEFLTRTIEIFEKKDKKVVLIYDMPDLTIDIKNCAFARPYLPSQSKCIFDKNYFNYDFIEYDEMISIVQKKTNVKIFDTRPFWKNFPIDSDGNLNYRDSTHLSRIGSLYFSDKYNFDK